MGPYRSSPYLLGLSLLALSCGQGGGCSDIRPLPAAPRPSGFPGEQLIEGGIQARVTKPGMDKLTSLIPPLIREQLARPFCVPPAEQNLIGIANIKECIDPCGGGQGCPVTITLPSDGIQISLPNGNMPLLQIGATFDVSVPVKVKISFFGAGIAEPTFQVRADRTQLFGAVRIGIDPPSGHLKLQLDTLRLDRLELRISGCGFVQAICDAISGYVSGLAQNAVRDYIISSLKPQLESLIQGFLPRPPGLAGTLDVSAQLKALNPPPGAALETYAVAGGYVSAYAGGLNLGVMAGLNSDAEPQSRGPGQTSDPARCVPARAAPILGAAPWNLPRTAARNAFSLPPAGEFSGLPDPRNDRGQVQDVALGISRTFFDLLGFHLINSGALCLELSASTVPQLSAGGLAVLAPSLSELLGELGDKTPVLLTLRPQGPLRFALGPGRAADGTPAREVRDALIQARIEDLRADLYVFIEERYVRLFTLSLSTDLGLNLVGAMVMGAPAVQPALVGINKSGLKVKVLNSQLLHESPETIATVFPVLISLALDALVGTIKPVPLPSIMGFSLEGVQFARVQAREDEFLALSAGLKLGSLRPMAARTTGELIGLEVPEAAAQRRALLAAWPAGQAQEGPLPEGVTTVVVQAGVAGAEPSHGEVEFSYRIDGGALRPFTPSPRLTVREPALLLPGRHTIEVVGRVGGELLLPARLEVDVPLAAPTVAAGCQVGRGAAGTGPVGLGLVLLLALLCRRRLVPLLLLLSGCAAEPEVRPCRQDAECRGPEARACPEETLGVCLGEKGCGCASEVPLGDVGRFSALSYGEPWAYVSAYNNSYGDLMLGRVRPPGVVSDWQFVDGVPDVTPDLPKSVIRGGIADPGDDVGRYTAIGQRGGRLYIAHHDATRRALRLCTTPALPPGPAACHQVEGTAGADIGRYAALSLAPDGRLDIAYLALLEAGQDGKPTSQLRLARSGTADPRSSADWMVSVLDSAPVPDVKSPLPRAVALFIAAARRPDGGLALAYYDHARGALRYVEEVGGKWQAPQVLAGPMMGMARDAGPYPALAVDAAGTAHLIFSDQTRGELRYMNTRGRLEEVIDDGWSSAETSLDGKPSPVHHLVGASSALLIADGRLYAAYQDATSGQVRLAVRDRGTWRREVVVGPERGRGVYGFYVGLVAGRPGQAVLSSYAIDQKPARPHFFVETFIIDVSR